YLIGCSRIMLSHRTAAAGARAVPETDAPVADADQELLELESWYWAWRSQATVDGTDRASRESLAVVDRMAGSGAHSIAGIAAKLRILHDMTESAPRVERRQIDIEARLLRGVLDDVTLLDRGAEARVRRERGLHIALLTRGLRGGGVQVLMMN